MVGVKAPQHHHSGVSPQEGRNIEVCNSFELDYTIKEGKLCIDMDYLEVKKEQCLFPTPLLLPKPHRRQPRGKLMVSQVSSHTIQLIFFSYKLNTPKPCDTTPEGSRHPLLTCFSERQIP